MSARYVVTLSLTDNIACSVRQEIRRADDSRALLYGRAWLRRSRLSTRYLGLSFDTWTVERRDGPDVLVVIGTGVDQERVPSRAEEVSRAPAKGRRLVSSGTIISQRYSPISVGKKPATGWRGKLNQQVEIARRKAATDGVISRMGGNTDRKEQDWDLGRLRPIPRS